MSNRAIKVLRKLSVQSAVPLVLALFYAWWEFRSLPEQSRHAASFVKSLGAAFFLVMWFAGQWFRAEKQIHDSERLSGIQDHLAEIHAKVIREGEGPKSNVTSPQISHETSHYKLYSNGVLVQNMTLRIAAGVEHLPLIFPLSFPNEVLSIQSVGDDLAWPVKATSGNCELKLRAAGHDRHIQLKITGI